MKIAFAQWNDRIAPVFDTAREVHVVETESGQVVARTSETLAEEFAVEKVLRLVTLGVDTLVCGAISGSMHSLVVAYGIRVVPFVAGDLNHMVRAFLGGQPLHDAFAMPGCRRRGGRHRIGTMDELNRKESTMIPKGRGMVAGGRNRQGQGGRRNGRAGMGSAVRSAGYCICPQCGQKEPHERGVPCMQRQCPHCGIPMTRQ